MRYLFVFVISGLVCGCSESQPDKTLQNPASFQKLPFKEVKAAFPQKVSIKKPLVFIPDTLQQAEGISSYTHTIGTTDHPTLDGGIINTTDKTPINHDEPRQISSLQASFFVKSLRTPDHFPLKDNWATNERVRKLLSAATRQGKLDYVLKQAKQLGLPGTVAIIPMVESNYQTAAISSKGAAGDWQLMPSVAKDYRIMNDERFEFTTATQVALQLLQDLHQRFGNWELAFAAYNAGSHRVLAALKKNPSPQTIEELDLPRDTKAYVNHIRAISQTLQELSIHAS